MPVSVVLDFVPPEIPVFTKLHIFESATQAGVPVLLETVTVDPASYPTRYTTALATAENYWFSIQWEDPDGGKTPLSYAMQGGTYTVVGKLINRVMLRDPSLNEAVVAQQAEWIVSMVFNTQDVYNVDPDTVTLAQYEGMTMLIMGRTYAASIYTSSTGGSYTAGLVAEKSDSSVQTSTDAIQYLIDQANALLGLNYSIIMMMPDFDPTGIGSTSGVEMDQTRLLATMYPLD